LDIRNNTPGLSNDESDFLPRPWEQSGYVRRDCDPHRGHLLVALACLSIAFGLMGCFLLIPTIPGLLFGVAGYWMACTDLDRMRVGTIDRNGRQATKEAERLSAIGLWLNLITCFFCGVIFLIVVLA
jgi:hypothetical protein